MKLYEITATLGVLWEQFSDVLDAGNTDPVEQTKALSFLDEQLKTLEGTHAAKCLDIACLIKNVEAEAEAVKAEEKRLGDRRKSSERKAEWLRTYLANNMEPGTNLKDPRAVIAWRKSSAVEITVTPQELPENMRRTKVIVEADKALIKENLESGFPIHGCSIVQRFNLQIK